MEQSPRAYWSLVGLVLNSPGRCVETPVNRLYLDHNNTFKNGILVNLIKIEYYEKVPDK